MMKLKTHVHEHFVYLKNQLRTVIKCRKDYEAVTPRLLAWYLVFGTFDQYSVMFAGMTLSAQVD
jgi:hypothetical protein